MYHSAFIEMLLSYNWLPFPQLEFSILPRNTQHSLEFRGGRGSATGALSWIYLNVEDKPFTYRSLTPMAISLDYWCRVVTLSDVPSAFDLFFSLPRALQWLFISGITGKMKGSPFLAQQAKAWLFIIDWSKRFGCVTSFLCILKDSASLIGLWRTPRCAYALGETSSLVSGEEGCRLPLASCGRLQWSWSYFTLDSQCCCLYSDVGNWETSKRCDFSFSPTPPRPCTPPSSLRISD